MSAIVARPRTRNGGFRREQTFNLATVNYRVWSTAVEPHKPGECPLACSLTTRLELKGGNYGYISENWRTRQDSNL
jgi:hypothetical protein